MLTGELIYSRYGTIGKLSGHSGTVTCMLVTRADRSGDICVTGSKDHYVKVRA